MNPQWGAVLRRFHAGFPASFERPDNEAGGVSRRVRRELEACLCGASCGLQGTAARSFPLRKTIFGGCVLVDFS